jgi:hypothetical protein
MRESGRIYALLLLVFLLSSCGLAIQPGHTLHDAQDDFVQRLRWQDCNGAARYLAPEVQSAFLESCQADDDLRFVLAEPESVELSDDQRQADTVTLLEYYRLPSVVVKKYRLRQQWSYRQGTGMKQGAWQVTSPFPKLP